MEGYREQSISDVEQRVSSIERTASKNEQRVSGIEWTVSDNERRVFNIERMGATMSGGLRHS